MAGDPIRCLYTAVGPVPWQLNFWTQDKSVWVIAPTGSSTKDTFRPREWRWGCSRLVHLLLFQLFYKWAASPRDAVLKAMAYGRQEADRCLAIHEQRAAAAAEAVALAEEVVQEVRHAIEADTMALREVEALLR